MTSPEKKGGLKELRDRIWTPTRVIYPNGHDWWGIFVYTIIEGKTFINSYDFGCLLANCVENCDWWSPEEIYQMPSRKTNNDVEKTQKTLDSHFSHLTKCFNYLRKPGMSDVKWLKDHPYYTNKPGVIAPVLKKDASEGDKLMAFFFAPKEETRPTTSPYEWL